MFVCLSVCWYVDGKWKSKPLNRSWWIFHVHPILSKEGYGAGLTPLPPGPVGLETVKAEGHIFKMLSRLQINPGSAGYLSYLI